MSKYSVRVIDDNEKQVWDDFIDKSDQGTIFHKYDWLKAAEMTSNSKLYPMVCEKDGEGIISLFPIYFLKKKFYRVILSPPNGCAIPFMGPVFIFNTKKQNKVESDSYNALSSFENYIGKHFKPHYQNLMTNLEDVRPLKWLNYSVIPNYSYKLQLKNSNTDAIYSNFDKRIRQGIKKLQENERISIKKGNKEQLKALVDSIKERYSEKNRQFKLTYAYLSVLYDSFGDSELKFKVIYINDKPITEFITLSYKNRVIFWLGGVKKKDLTDGANEFIHWYNITNSLEEGKCSYERIGANNKELCKNKSKYGLKPYLYFKAEKSTAYGKILLKIYECILKRNK